MVVCILVQLICGVRGAGEDDFVWGEEVDNAEYRWEVQVKRCSNIHFFRQVLSSNGIFNFNNTNLLLALLTVLAVTRKFSNGGIFIQVIVLVPFLYLIFLRNSGQTQSGLGYDYVNRIRKRLDGMDGEYR